jgi:hypothetical protein
MEGNNTPQRPIFMVGCPSSGTTLLQSILEAHPNISCGQETDFLVSCRSIVEGQYWKKLQDYGFEQKYWYEKVAELFHGFKADYAEKQGKTRWADKSPCYTPHLDFIHALFPNCQFVHIIRDGRDVVSSHQRRWGYKSAIKAIYIWKQYVKSAREFGKTLPANQYFEFRYEDLVSDPESTTKAIFDYLQETWNSQYLEYDKSPSFDKNRGFAQYTEQQRQQSEEKSLIYKTRVGTGRKLDPMLTALVNIYHQSLRQELGY